MLESRHIVDTAGRLRERIEQRFAGSSLSRVAREVHRQSELTEGLIATIARPNWYLRGVNALLLAGIGGILVYLATHFPMRLRASDFEALIQFVEPALGSMVFIGAFVLFIWNLENRWRRWHVLRAVHELRSVAHVIDMHQLTKDPERLVMPGPDTEASPDRTMSAFELGRYLDYCTELLAVLSKVGALWARHFTDPEVLRAVDQVENLTSGLSRKIWQKMTMLVDMVNEKSRS